MSACETCGSISCCGEGRPAPAVEREQSIAQAISGPAGQHVLKAAVVLAGAVEPGATILFAIKDAAPIVSANGQQVAKPTDFLIVSRSDIYAELPLSRQTRVERGGSADARKA